MRISVAFLFGFTFALLLWQYLILPRIRSPSLYKVLGVSQDATIEDISQAYGELCMSHTRMLHANEKGFDERKLIEIHHAYEILSDTLKRRDYDIFGVDDLQEIVQPLLKSSHNAPYKMEPPFWDPYIYEPLESKSISLELKNFGDLLAEESAWLIQIYSMGSRKSQKFAPTWEIITSSLDGVARCGRVELGEKALATFFAERKASGSIYFRTGLPYLVAMAPDCRKQDCLLRYSGVLTADNVIDWMATRVLRLPQIFYYNHERLVMDLILKSGSHKVKVIIFSTSGERALPYLRKAAKTFGSYAAFGLVLWREENSSSWESMFGLESAPAVVFLRDPGLQPIIHYGEMDSSSFEKLMEQNKWHVLPQLRSVTASELGCDETGYSRAGKQIDTWYCVIVAGRAGLELSHMRGVLRNVQDNLTAEVLVSPNDAHSSPLFSDAASAFQTKRLTFTWLDGELQKDLCYFYLNSESAYETCGPKNIPETRDTPQVFLVRYRRDPVKEEEEKQKRKKRLNTLWDKLLEDDEKLASHIVARYKGSGDLSELLAWIYKMIREGDTQDLLYYRKKAPSLVPEDSKPAWLEKARGKVLDRREGLYETFKSFIFGLSDYANDQKLSSFLVLLVALYMGRFFLRSNSSRN